MRPLFFLLLLLPLLLQPARALHSCAEACGCFDQVPASVQ
jgi:hypothetical protein